MAPAINVCTLCEGVQLIGSDGVGRDLDGTPTPMLHNADQLFTGNADDVELDSWHFDCLPAKLENTHRPVYGKAIDAAKTGTRGEKLLKLIEQGGNAFNADDEDDYNRWLNGVRASVKKAGKAAGAAGTVGLMTLLLFTLRLLTVLRLTKLLAALEPVLGNALNDVLLPNAASGTLTLGSVTLTRPYNCRFQSTRGVAGTAGTNITGTNSVGINGLFTSASASISNVPTKSNTGAISITTTSSGTWNGVEIWDTTATPQRVLFGPTADLGKAFASGDILSVPTGNMTLTTT